MFLKLHCHKREAFKNTLLEDAQGQLLPQIFKYNLILKNIPMPGP